MFEASDIIAITSAIVSIGLSIYIFRFTKSQSKKTTTLHMHQLWTSDSMRSLRSTAYYGIKNRAGDGEKVAYSSFAQDDIGKDLGSIEHFFADLYHLLASDSVDIDLSRRLFGSAAHAWFSNVFSKIEYDIEEEEGFFINEMAPLMGLLREKA